jgi:5,10-methylenetetrahydromethanopterin reductase
MVSPTYNAEAMKHLEAGARKAGRKVADIDRPQLVVCSVDRDRAKALYPARELLTQYLGQQPHIMKASGVDPDLIKKINDVVGWPATPEKIREAMRHVPDSVVQQVAAAGTPDECRSKVAEYEASGCTCPVLYPLGDDVRLMLDTFGQGS